MIRTVVLLIALAACGDNGLDPNPLTSATAQSGASATVLAGTYTLASFGPSGTTIGWTLSDPGCVHIELRGLAGGARLGLVRVQAKATAEPVIRVVDQVDNESLVLATAIAGDVVGHGLVVHALTEPLVIGSAGEFVSIRIETAGSPVTVFSLAWEAP